MAEAHVSRTVRAGSFRTRFIEAGEPGAPPVLLVHDGAWGADAHTSWGTLAERLGSDHHVLAPDLLGFGGTDKAIFFDQSRFAFRWQHLLEFLDVLDISEPVHLVGASFGGSLVLRGAARPRDAVRVRSLASISGTGGPWRVASEFANLTEYDGSAEHMERIIGYLADPFPGLAEQVARRQENAARIGHFQAMGAVRMEALGEHPAPTDPADPFPDSLRGVDVPLLFIEGRRDVLLETGWGERLREAVGRGTVVTLDARHSPNIDRPDEVAEVLTEFFSTVAKDADA